MPAILIMRNMKTASSISQRLDMEDIPRLTFYNKADLVGELLRLLKHHMLRFLLNLLIVENSCRLYCWIRLRKFLNLLIQKGKLLKSYKIHDLEVLSLEERDY